MKSLEIWKELELIKNTQVKVNVIVRYNTNARIGAHGDPMPAIEELLPVPPMPVITQFQEIPEDLVTPEIVQSVRIIVESLKNRLETYVKMRSDLVFTAEQLALYDDWNNLMRWTVDTIRKKFDKYL